MAGFLMVTPGFRGNSTRKKAARRIVPISETEQFPKYMPNAAIQAATLQRLRVLQPPSCRATSAVPETLALGNLQQPPIQAA